MAVVIVVLKKNFSFWTSFGYKMLDQFLLKDIKL